MLETWRSLQVQKGEEIEIVAARLQQVTGPKTQTLVGELLEKLRNE